MKRCPELIVMLTYNDRTVQNAYEIFKKNKEAKAMYWGIKEKGLPQADMKKLCSYIKECGKTAVIEVVAYSEEECLSGAKLAVKCGFDILMGTVFYDSVNEYCKKHKLKYMPFVGKVENRPSVLSGGIDEMISCAEEYLEKGVYGFDLLAYRYKGDSEELIRKFVSGIDAPVCVAGSISDYEKINTVLDVGAWAFTIGGALFEEKFGNDFSGQIDAVCDFLKYNGE